MKESNQHEPNVIKVQSCLWGMDYPASKQDLIRHAQVRGAGEDIIEPLKALENKLYESPIDVSKALGNRS